MSLFHKINQDKDCPEFPVLCIDWWPPQCVLTSFYSCFASWNLLIKGPDEIQMPFHSKHLQRCDCVLPHTMEFLPSTFSSLSAESTTNFLVLMVIFYFISCYVCLYFLPQYSLMITLLMLSLLEWSSDCFNLSLLCAGSQSTWPLFPYNGSWQIPEKKMQEKYRFISVLFPFFWVHVP